jgi:hypothetical protein
VAIVQNERADNESNCMFETAKNLDNFSEEDDKDDDDNYFGQGLL